MKPWREIVFPIPMCWKARFSNRNLPPTSPPFHGQATREYQDAAAFFQRTFITEGMRLLLIQVAQRLNGKGGEPVIQLQTAFGGGRRILCWPSITSPRASVRWATWRASLLD